MKPKLFTFQKKGVRKLHHFHGAALLADDMGLGKTLQVLQYLHEKEAWPAVVVCPAFLKLTWEREAGRLLSIPSFILNGKNPPTGGFGFNHKLYIINYEIIQYWIEYIRKLKPLALIMDECHYIKNRGAKRTKIVRTLAKHVPIRVGVSGTPLLNRPAELFPVLNVLRPELYSSFFPFAMRYCNPKRLPWGWNYNGASNLGELHRKMKRTCLIRQRKKDVLTELPDKNRIVLPMEMENKKDYLEASQDFIAWLRKESPGKVHAALKAESLVRLGYLKRLAALSKIKSVLNWIDNYFERSNDKLVLFCIHQKIIQIIHERYKTKTVMVDGTTPMRKRQQYVDAFQTNKEVKLFLGQIKAAGVGLTLTAASTVGFVELDWVPANHAQAEDRIHRIGQKESCDIFYFVAQDTIEIDLCDIIQDKQSILSQTLDGKADNDLNLSDLLNTPVFNLIMDSYRKKKHENHK